MVRGQGEEELTIAVSSGYSCPVASMWRQERAISPASVGGVDVSRAIAPLEPGYAALLARVEEAMRDDERVRALWLAGSVGRGVADAGSDLDLVVTVVDVHAFAEPAVWAAARPVITTPIPGMPGCFAFTTREGLRVDVVLETPADVAGIAVLATGAGLRPRRARAARRRPTRPRAPTSAGCRRW